MIIDGACNCGASRYQAQANPRQMILCHCTDCQTITGAPYRATIRALAASVRMTGQPTTYVKTGGSGAYHHRLLQRLSVQPSTLPMARRQSTCRCVSAPSNSAPSLSPERKASASPACRGPGTSPGFR